LTPRGPCTVRGYPRHEYPRGYAGGCGLLLAVIPRIYRVTRRWNVDVIRTHVWCAKLYLTTEMNVARGEQGKLYCGHAHVQRITADGIDLQRQISCFQHLAGLVHIAGLHRRRRPKPQLTHVQLWLCPVRDRD